MAKKKPAKATTRKLKTYIPIGEDTLIVSKSQFDGMLERLLSLEIKVGVFGETGEVQHDIKAAEQRCHAQIVELVKQTHTLRELVADALANGSEWRGNCLKELDAVKDQHNGLGGSVDDLIKRVKFLEEQRTAHVEILMLVDERLSALEAPKPPFLHTRLYRAAVAWFKSFKCNNPSCPKCYPPSKYNEEHPMTKGGANWCYRGNCAAKRRNTGVFEVHWTCTKCGRGVARIGSEGYANTPGTCPTCGGRMITRQVEPKEGA